LNKLIHSIHIVSFSVLLLVSYYESVITNNNTRIPTRHVCHHVSSRRNDVHNIKYSSDIKSNLQPLSFVLLMAAVRLHGMTSEKTIIFLRFTLILLYFLRVCVKRIFVCRVFFSQILVMISHFSHARYMSNSLRRSRFSHSNAIAGIIKFV
jgi:hypothetical protein